MSKNMRVNAMFIQAQVPLLNAGGPGLGKTRGLYAVAKALGYNMEVLPINSMDPTEVQGIYCPPRERGEGVYREPVDWVLRVHDAWVKHKRRTVVFLDEMNTAPVSVMAPAMKVIDERRAGNVQLDGASFVAAINPPELACGGQEIPPPMANRFGHRDWESDNGEWIKGMIEGWQEPSIPRLPSDWETLIPTSRSVVASFIKHKPTMLYQIPKTENQRGQAWPSPRTWDMAARMVAAGESCGLGRDEQAEVIMCLVGQGPAMEFANWRKEMDLPDPEWVLANWKKFEVKKMRMDQMFALSAGVAAAFLQNKNTERWEAVWGVLGKVAEAEHADIVGLAAKTVVDSVLKLPATQRRKDFPFNKNFHEHFLPVMAELNKE